MDAAKNKSIKSLIQSKDKTDQQFINMFRMRKATNFGVQIGFNGFKE